MSSYVNFFTASASVAGALTGLLFVALSVSPERLRGTTGSLEHQAIAATAFTALIDALFVSLAGLTPGGSTRLSSVIMGLLGLSSSAGLGWRLWTSRHGETLSKRWPYLLSLIIVMYLTQVILAIATRSAADSDSDSVTFIMIMFAVGIARSWELLGLRGGGVLDLFVQRLDRSAHGEAPRRPQHAQAQDDQVSLDDQ